MALGRCRSADAASGMTSLDFLIVAAFVAYAVGSGLRNRRAASRNLEEYFLANRSLSGWQAGLSMAATQFAADTRCWSPVSSRPPASSRSGSSGSTPSRSC